MGTRKRKVFWIGAAGMTAALLIGSAVAVAGPGPRADAKGLVRGVHTEVSLIRANGSTDAFVVDRGQVTAESQTSFTLARKDGVNVTLGLAAATKVRGDIQVGKGAVAYSRGGAAFLVLAPRAERATLGKGLGKGLGRGLGRPAGAGLGLVGAVHADVKLIRADKSQDQVSFDRGQITAASTSSVTIKRADGPSVTKSISTATTVRGTLAVGGRAAVFSRGSAAFAVLAVPPRP